MISATIKLKVPSDKRKELFQTFIAILNKVRREKGCMSFHCYTDIEAETNIFFVGEWNSREELDAHLRSDQFGVLKGAMKLLNEEPEIRFITIDSTTGGESSGTPK